MRDDRKCYLDLEGKLSDTMHYSPRNLTFPSTGSYRPKPNGLKYIKLRDAYSNANGMHLVQMSASGVACNFLFLQGQVFCVAQYAKELGSQRVPLWATI